MGKRILILASGRGSNFTAIATAITGKEIPQATLVGLITNNPSAGALEKAKQLEVPTFIVDSNRYKVENRFERSAYEKALEQTVNELRPDLICLAGYKLLLGKSFVSKFANQIINIHPSLLPAFKGLKAHQQAIDYGVRWTGCTVHFVTPEMDEGPIIRQSTLEIKANDTASSLATRLLPVEHQTYIDSIKDLCTRPYEIMGRRICWLD